MRQTIKLLLASMLIVSTLNCSGDDSGESAPRVTIDAVGQLAVIDYGNEGDARDLFIHFVPPMDEQHIEEYNLVLVRTGSSTQITNDMTKTLSPDRYYTIAKTGQAIREQVGATFLDADGDAIVPDQVYNAFVFSRASDETIAGRISTRIFVELKDQPYYEVKTWLTFQGMEAISYYPPGNYFIGPSANGTLAKIDLATKTVSQFASGLATPYGGGFDPATGTYYASNFDSGQVWGYDTEGNRTVVRTGLNGPTGIAVDREGSIYVNNYWSSTITKITSEGQSSVFSNNTSRLIKGPDGIIFAGEQLYCINFDNSDILKVSDAGEVTLFARLPGAEMGYLAYGDGSLYAASLSEKKIFRINQNGQHEAIAGNGVAAMIDGPAPLSSFNNPNGIAFVEGVVYVGDGSTIRTIVRHD